MKRFSYKILLVLFALIVFCSSLTLADVGNFESYDSGWDYGWDSSWDSDSNWDYGGGTYVVTDGSPISFIVLLVMIIIFFIKFKNNSSYHVPKDYKINNSSIPNSRNIAKEIINVDQYFNEEKFLAWTKDLFVKLQNAWTARNLEEIRNYETESLFEQHSKQVQQYINNKQINAMERIAVNYANLYSFEQDNDKDTLCVLLNSSMADYIIDEETLKVLQGDKITRRTKTYVMTFIRKKGVKTAKSTDELKTTNCPNCGAPTNVTSSGKCDYCGSVITTGNHDWVLSNLEPFRN